MQQQPEACTSVLGGRNHVTCDPKEYVIFHKETNCKTALTIYLDEKNQQLQFTCTNKISSNKTDKSKHCLPGAAASTCWLSQCLQEQTLPQTGMIQQSTAMPLNCWQSPRCRLMSANRHCQHFSHVYITHTVTLSMTSLCNFFVAKTLFSIKHSAVLQQTQAYL